MQGVNETLDAVIKPVQEGSSALAVMATGDLTVRMQGEYQGDLQLIKESINKVGTSLEDALRKVSEAVSATASASSQISSSTEQMAAGAQEQTSQAGEVASCRGRDDEHDPGELEERERGGRHGEAGPGECGAGWEGRGRHGAGDEAYRGSGEQERRDGEGTGQVARSDRRDHRRDR